MAARHANPVEPRAAAGQSAARPAISEMTSRRRMLPSKLKETARRHHITAVATMKRDQAVAERHGGRRQTTLSARVSRFIGTVKPIALAVSRLIASSNVVGCSIGSSAGLAPRRMRPAYLPTITYMSDQRVP